MGPGRDAGLAIAVFRQCFADFEDEGIGTGVMQQTGFAWLPAQGAGHPLQGMPEGAAQRRALESRQKRRRDKTTDKPVTTCLHIDFSFFISGVLTNWY